LPKKRWVRIVCHRDLAALAALIEKKWENDEKLKSGEAKLREVRPA